MMQEKKRSTISEFLLFGALPLAAFWLFAVIVTLLEAEGHTAMLEPLMAARQIVAPALLMPVCFSLALWRRVPVWKLFLLSAAAVSLGDLIWLPVATTVYDIPLKYVDLVAGDSFIYGYLSELLVLALLFGLLLLVMLIIGRRPAAQRNNAAPAEPGFQAAEPEAARQNVVTYRSNAGLLLLSMLFAWVVLILIAMIAFYLFRTRRGELQTLYIIWAACLPLAMLFSLLFRNIHVEVDDNGVRMMRGRASYRTFFFREVQITSFIQRYRFNFIPMPSTKYLRVISLSGTQKMYPCHSFSKKTITALIADITGRQRALYERLRCEQGLDGDLEGLNHIDAPEDYVEADNYADYLEETAASRYNDRGTSKQTAIVQYTLPKDKILAGERSRLMKMMFGLVVSGVIMLALYYFFFYRRYAAPGDPVLALTAALILLIFILFPPLFTLIRNRLIARRIPEMVTIHADGFEVDGEFFSLDDVQHIQMTPPGYVQSGAFSHQRKLKLTALNQRFTWLFGSSIAAGAGFAKYPSLCRGLELLFSVKDIYIYKL